MQDFDWPRSYCLPHALAVKTKRRNAIKQTKCAFRRYFCLAAAACYRRCAASLPVPQQVLDMFTCMLQASEQSLKHTQESVANVLLA
jgi:hypothetical protein